MKIRKETEFFTAEEAEELHQDKKIKEAEVANKAEDLGAAEEDREMVEADEAEPDSDHRYSLYNSNLNNYYCTFNYYLIDIKIILLSDTYLDQLLYL